MKKLNLLAAVLVMAMIAVPASASVQNVKISGSVDSTYLLRKNFDFGNETGSGNALDDTFQSLFLTQTILRVDADLTDQVSATIALINERVWNADESPSGNRDPNGVDVYLAYVTLREMLYSPLTLVIGRQDFRFGNSAIMDSTGSNNVAPASSGLSGVAGDLTKQTSLDAIRATLDYNPLTVDLLYIVVSSDSSTPNADFRDDSIFGTNLNYQVGDEMDSEVEAYFWYKNNRSTVAALGDKADKIKIVGLRASTNPIEGLNIQAEWAHQGGSKNFSPTTNKRRNAQFVQAIVNYQVPAMEEYNPVLQYVFTKATGDKDIQGDDTDQRDWTAWDPFFEAQGGGTIYNNLFNLSGLIIHSLSVTANPMEDVTAKLSLHALWLERTTDGGNLPLRQPDQAGNAATNLVGTKADANTWLGKEIDFNLAYDYTEDVQFGLALGWFLPGSVFTPTRGGVSDDAAKQALVNVNVSF